MTGPTQCKECAHHVSVSDRVGDRTSDRIYYDECEEVDSMTEQEAPLCETEQCPRFVQRDWEKEKAENEAYEAALMKQYLEDEKELQEGM